ncbi:unnamed protein product, partial [Allacma fusca]
KSRGKFKLKRTVKDHDEEHPKNRIVDYNFFVKPLSQSPDPSHRIPHRFLYDQELKKDWNINKHSDNKLWQVCAGKIEQTPEVKSELFCWYETEIHMTYKIGPIKAKIHSLSNMSAVIHYHDVLSARAVEELKVHTYNKPSRLFIATGDYNPFSGLVLRKVDTAMASNLSQVTMDLMLRITGYKKPPESRPIDGHYFVYGPGAARGRHWDIVSNFIPSTISSSLEKHEKLYSKVFAPDAVEGDQYQLHSHLKRSTPYEVVVNGKPIQ